MFLESEAGSCTYVRTILISSCSNGVILEAAVLDDDVELEILDG